MVPRGGLTQEIQSTCEFADFDHYLVYPRDTSHILHFIYPYIRHDIPDCSSNRRNRKHAVQEVLTMETFIGNVSHNSLSLIPNVSCIRLCFPPTYLHTYKPTFL